MQTVTKDRRGRSHLLRCLSDRWIVRMAVRDHAAISRTIAQQIQSVTHHSTLFAVEWNVHKASIASFTFDWKPQTFAPSVVR
ncbi:hypothetical protein TNCV_1043821 [Trichonephila clavipes]|nr:hypothetical protein TNCV_1043821 [Trichonephila clavipes]